MQTFGEGQGAAAEEICMQLVPLAGEGPLLQPLLLQLFDARPEEEGGRWVGMLWNSWVRKEQSPAILTLALGGRDPLPSWMPPG